MNRVVGWRCNGVETPVRGDSEELFVRESGVWWFFFEVWGGPPLFYHESRSDGTGSHEAEGLMSVATSVQQQEGNWAGHTGWCRNRRENKREGGTEERGVREKGKRPEEDGRRKGENIFLREVGKESVRFDYLLLYLILFLRITLRFLLIFRWLLWLPKEANLFPTFVYLILFSPVWAACWIYFVFVC